jgi:acyl-CoA thioester hydrolase
VLGTSLSSQQVGTYAEPFKCPIVVPGKMTDEVPVTLPIPDQGVVITHYTVLPEWLDYNNHMNVAYYIATFDLGIDALKAVYGINASYIENEKRSTVALEAHITYHNEASLGEQLDVHTRVLDFDAKRTHLYQEMYRGDVRLATQETLSISFNLQARKSCAFDETVAARIAALHGAQQALPRPTWAGQAVGIRRKSTSA